MNKSSKALIIFLFAILALPIPLSLASWLGTLMAVANIDMMKGGGGVMIVALPAMILAGTYPITYGFSLYLTLKKKCLGWVSFLPIVHIILTAGMIVLWFLFEKSFA